MRQQLRSRSLFASATTLCWCLQLLTPALAATGSVYFYTNGNAATGEPRRRVDASKDR